MAYWNPYQDSKNSQNLLGYVVDFRFSAKMFKHSSETRSFLVSSVGWLLRIWVLFTILTIFTYTLLVSIDELVKFLFHILFICYLWMLRCFFWRLICNNPYYLFIFCMNLWWLQFMMKQNLFFFFYSKTNEYVQFKMAFVCQKWYFSEV